MSARPADLISALDKLIARGGRDMPGAFPAGPTSGTELLPRTRCTPCGPGPRTGCRSIVGHQRRRGQVVHPVHAAAADERADHRDAAGRFRPRVPRTGSSRRTRTIRASRPVSGWAGTSPSARPHGISPRRTVAHAPDLLLPLRLCAARPELVRHGRHPCDRTARGVRHLPDPPRCAAHRRRGPAPSAKRVSREIQSRWGEFSRTGGPGEGWPRYDEACAR